MENKITWAGFWVGVLAVIVWLWNGFSKMTVWLWKAYFEKVRFPMFVAVMFLFALLGFFIGRHYPIQNLESEPVAIMPTVELPSISKPPRRVVVDTSEADKAKVKAEEARLKAEADKAKADELEAKRKAKAEADAKAKAIEEAKVQSTVNVVNERKKLVVKERMVIFYNKDLDFPLKYALFVGESDLPAHVGECKKALTVCPVTFENTAIILRAFMDQGPNQDSPDFIKRPFTDKDTPVALVYENGKITVTKDLTVLPVNLLNADGTKWSLK